MRGPKREVIDVARVGKTWFLKLKCRDVVERRVQRRRVEHGHWLNGKRISTHTTTEEDPAPTWVYCEKCAKGAAS